MQNLRKCTITNKNKITPLEIIIIKIKEKTSRRIKKNIVELEILLKQSKKYQEEFLKNTTQLEILKKKM